MKKILVILIVLMIVFSSTIYAQEMPSSFLIVGDKVVDLNYAMGNKVAFNVILTNFFMQGGNINGLYMFLGGTLYDVFGKSMTETQKQSIISNCTILIDYNHPNGTPLSSEDLEVIGIY